MYLQAVSWLLAQYWRTCLCLCNFPQILLCRWRTLSAAFSYQWRDMRLLWWIRWVEGIDCQSRCVTEARLWYQICPVWKLMLTLLYATAMLVACFRLSVSIQRAGQRQTGCSPVTKSLEQPTNYYVWDIKNKETLNCDINWRNLSVWKDTKLEHKTLAEGFICNFLFIK